MRFLKALARCVRYHTAGMMTAICLIVASPLNHQAVARESFSTVPSARLVSDFFDHAIKIIFLDQPTGSPATQMAALRDILASTTDAPGISHFILGRFGASQQVSNATSATTATDGFLDFVATAMLRMAPRHPDASGHVVAPALAILTTTIRADQMRLVQSELILPNGRSLPLTWEVADRPAGLRIEDVNCLGISLRLMLRSAVAEAAAEHPEDAHDLGRLLQSDQTLGQFSGAAGTP